MPPQKDIININAKDSKSHWAYMSCQFPGPTTVGAGAAARRQMNPVQIGLRGWTPVGTLQTAGVPGTQLDRI